MTCTVLINALLQVEERCFKTTTRDAFVLVVSMAHRGAAAACATRRGDEKERASRVEVGGSFQTLEIGLTLSFIVIKLSLTK
jgi:hypothetical protein